MRSVAFRAACSRRGAGRFRQAATARGRALRVPERVAMGALAARAHLPAPVQVSMLPAARRPSPPPL